MPELREIVINTDKNDTAPRVRGFCFKKHKPALRDSL